MFVKVKPTLVEPTMILDVNGAQVRLFAAEAPYFSRIDLFHKDKVISNSAIDPEYLSLVKQKMDSYDNFMGTMRKINNQLKSKYLEEFIELIDNHKNGTTTSTASLNF